MFPDMLDIASQLVLKWERFDSIRFRVLYR